MKDSNHSEQTVLSLPEKVVWASYLLLVFSLGFMQPYFYAISNRIVLTDLLFLVTFAIWFILLIFRKLRFRWNSAFWVIGFYLGVMLVSALFSTAQYQSRIKFLTIVYLVGLAVMTANLVRSKRHLKQVFITWIVATACAIFIALLTLSLFYIDRDNWLLRYTLSHYGTLPPGNYPRIQGTFVNPNMFCNYLSLGFAAFLASQKLGWVDSKFFIPVGIAFSIACFFTLSPGIGGILLIAGIWFWLSKRESRNKRLGKLGLTVGIGTALVFFLATIFTPIKSETSPFHVVVPSIEMRLDPSSRFLAWKNSLETFWNYPITGKGIGTNIAQVSYRNPTGRLESLTDSHQMWLHLLGQAGLPGFIAIGWIGIFFLRRTVSLKMYDEKGILKNALGIGLIGAFLYQGLSGSYEDARHLWVWFGLIAAISHSDFIWNTEETLTSRATR